VHLTCKLPPGIKINDSNLVDSSQFICLTIGPAFLTASIYLCLTRIIIVHGQQFSRFRPRTYSLVFVGVDLVCLILQAIGGAFAATATTKAEGDMGAHIMIGGLAFQIFSLLMFMALWVDFDLRVRRAKSTDAGSANDEVLELSELRASFRFKAFKAGKISLRLFYYSNKGIRALGCSNLHISSLYLSSCGAPRRLWQRRCK
jgi:hypothetical protein